MLLVPNIVYSKRKNSKKFYFKRSKCCFDTSYTILFSGLLFSVETWKLDVWVGLFGFMAYQPL